jgi:hypothetical protein
MFAGPARWPSSEQPAYKRDLSDTCIEMKIHTKDLDTNYNLLAL